MLTGRVNSPNAWRMPMPMLSVTMVSAQAVTISTERLSSMAGEGELLAGILGMARCVRIMRGLSPVSEDDARGLTESTLVMRGRGAQEITGIGLSKVEPSARKGYR